MVMDLETIWGVLGKTTFIREVRYGRTGYI
jgi:hypothetical protein